MNNIPALQNTGTVINAEFIKLTLSKVAGGTDTFTFSNSYKTETINGTQYSALGSYLSVATQQRDLRATSYDTMISLSGVVAENIGYVLGDTYLIKGSTVEIWRGFYDANYNLNTTTSPPARRYTGIITSWNVTEKREEQDGEYTISINCSNFKTVLENRVSGRFTNQRSWQFRGQSTDTSMNRVASLVNAFFDFGKPATSSGTATNINKQSSPPQEFQGY